MRGVRALGAQRSRAPHSLCLCWRTRSLTPQRAPPAPRGSGSDNAHAPDHSIGAALISQQHPRQQEGVGGEQQQEQQGGGTAAAAAGGAAQPRWRSVSGGTSSEPHTRTHTPARCGGWLSGSSTARWTGIGTAKRWGSGGPPWRARCLARVREGWVLGWVNGGGGGCPPARVSTALVGVTGACQDIPLPPPHFLRHPTKMARATLALTLLLALFGA